MPIESARVSIPEEGLGLRLDALARVGCDKISSDTMSGAWIARPHLERAFPDFREGDALVD
ncbi:hypothetical protein OJF2_40490 [Aquisphaera giovannonii]|uniref:Resolvase/invertase-type recombinase catalytic domain-containing protein n=1 Tax=Aquisphaera giovannonii TaxID=406548 RepID=A0A5B9W5C4_9BACT|nr:hypothetical protein [Aquisphaera giovannonii]QEH35497.1 hypothetical protein OJF2_40490 [Aquisphaera giovannonii]